MRLFFVALFVILGANLGIELLDSNMTQIIKERNESIHVLSHLWNTPHNRNVFNSSHRTGWVYIIFKDDAHTSNNI